MIPGLRSPALPRSLPLPPDGKSVPNRLPDPAVDAMKSALGPFLPGVLTHIVAAYMPDPRIAAARQSLAAPPVFPVESRETSRRESIRMLDRLDSEPAWRIAKDSREGLNYALYGHDEAIVPALFRELFKDPDPVEVARESLSLFEKTRPLGAPGDAVPSRDSLQGTARDYLVVLDHVRDDYPCVILDGLRIPADWLRATLEAPGKTEDFLLALQVRRSEGHAKFGGLSDGALARHVFPLFVEETHRLFSLDHNLDLLHAANRSTVRKIVNRAQAAVHGNDFATVGQCAAELASYSDVADKQLLWYLNQLRMNLSRLWVWAENTQPKAPSDRKAVQASAPGAARQMG